MVREAQGEEAGQVTLLRAAGRLGVGYPADGVLLLQPDVHHQLLVAHVAAYHFAQAPRLVVHLHGLHGVGGQVVEHDGAVAPEEVLAVEQQALHVAPVDEDASVVLQLHARQLADEGVEHGAFL